MRILLRQIFASIMYGSCSVHVVSYLVKGDRHYLWCSFVFFLFALLYEIIVELIKINERNGKL